MDILHSDDNDKKKEFDGNMNENLLYTHILHVLSLYYTHTTYHISVHYY